VCGVCVSRSLVDIQFFKKLKNERKDGGCWNAGPQTLSTTAQ
jgi:hypothetical protein